MKGQLDYTYSLIWLYVIQPQLEQVPSQLLSDADLPHPTLPGSLQPPSHPPPLPSFEAVIANLGGMEGESSATRGKRLNYRLTAIPPAAGANTPNTCPVTACLLELYQECVVNSVWAHVLCEASDRIEKLTFLHKMAPPCSCQPG
jgi:hypothetical protein